MAVAYNNFSTEKLFKDESINIICNTIYEAIIQKFSTAVIDSIFCTSGTVAKIIQGAPSENIIVMPFVTSNIAVLDFAITELPSIIKVNGTVKLTDRVQLIFDNIYVEIWYLAAIGTINTVSNLRVQDTADIPAYIN